MENQALWGDPPWVCKFCGFTNMAVRQHCRNFQCGKHVDLSYPGEVYAVEAACLTVTDVAGTSIASQLTN